MYFKLYLYNEYKNQGLCYKPSLFSVKLTTSIFAATTPCVNVDTVKIPMAHGMTCSVPLKHLRKTLIFDKANSYGRIR